MRVSPVQFVLVLLTALAWSLPAAAVSVKLPRTDGDIAVDGRLDDAAWQDAVQVELSYEIDPGENIPARVKTVAYLMEDGTNLLVGFRASDPDPSAIRAYLRDRDKAYDDDVVGIVIDTYNDSRRAFQFFSNPLGVQMDMINNELASGGQWNKEDASWNAIWDSAGRINDEGYAVEMKIPLTQLRFPVNDGPKVWGFDVKRTYPRDNRYQFSSVTHDRGANCYLCQIGEFSGLADAEPGRDIEIVPTLTASNEESSEDPGIEPLVRESGTEVGASIRWGISPDLTANLAINPDFSQVEADAAQLSVNRRFALFFPETRPFFLEGADYFSTPIQAVFTRSISSPDVGVKLSGKRGDHTFGVIAAEDAVTNLLFPGQFESDSESFEQSNTAFIGRYSLGFQNTSSLGGVVTARTGDGYENVVGGIDGRWRLNDQHTFTAQHIASETEYPLAIAEEFDQPEGKFDGSASLFRYEYDSRNWFGSARLTDVTEGFRADSGFLSRVGTNKIRLDGRRIWHGDESTWWNWARIRTEYSIDHLEDGTFLEREVSVGFSVTGPWQSWTSLDVEQGRTLEEGVLFDTTTTGLYTEFSPKSGLFLSLYAQYGDQIDYDNTRLGDQTYFQPSFRWNLNRNLLVSFNGTFVGLDTKEGEQIFDANVIDARLTWQFSVRSFIRLTLQQYDTSRNPDEYIEDVEAESSDVGRQLLYSYKLNPQTVFFLGYADEYIDEDYLDGRTLADRSVFMKIGYAWNL